MARIGRLSQIGVGAKDYPGFTSRSGVINADAPITEEADRLSAEATAEITASAAIVEAGDSIVASVGVDISADSAVTESGDSLSASGSVVIPDNQIGRLGQIGIGVRNYLGFSEKELAPLPTYPTALLQERDDVLASDGAVTGGPPITASSIITEAGDITSSEALLIVGGDHTPGHITRHGQIGIGVSPYGAFGSKLGSRIGDADLREEGDRVDASATVLVSADGVLTEAPDSSTAGASILITADAAITEENDRVSSDAGTAGFAYLSVLEEGDSLAGIAENPISAQTIIVEDGDRSSASVGVAHVADASIREGGDHLASTVLVTGGFTRVADCDLIERGDIVVSNAGVLISALASITEEPDRLVSQTVGGDITIEAILYEQGDSVSATATHLGPGRGRHSDRGRKVVRSDAASTITRSEFPS